MSYDSCEVKPAGKGADLSGGAYLRWQNSEFRVYKQLTIGPAQATGMQGDLVAWAADRHGARLVWVALLPHGDCFFGE